MLGCFVVAPFNDIKSIIVNGQDVFPLIHFGDQFQIEFSPPELEGNELGLGMLERMAADCLRFLSSTPSGTQWRKTSTTLT